MPLRLSFEISKAHNSPRLSNFASNLQIRCKPSTTAVLSYHLSSSQASHHRDHKFTLSNFKQAHNSFLLFYKLPRSRCLFLAINSYRAPTADLRGKKNSSLDRRVSFISSVLLWQHRLGLSSSDMVSYVLLSPAIPYFLPPNIFLYASVWPCMMW